jgi:hypothetical protein
MNYFGAEGLEFGEETPRLIQVSPQVSCDVRQVHNSLLTNTKNYQKAVE